MSGSVTTFFEKKEVQKALNDTHFNYDKLGMVDDNHKKE